MKKRMSRSILSFVLAVIMIIPYLPVALATSSTPVVSVTSAATEARATTATTAASAGPAVASQGSEVAKSAEFETMSSTVSPGDYIQLGKHNSLPLLWRCVDTTNGALLLSDKIITNMAFGLSQRTGNPETLTDEELRLFYGSNKWETSPIRGWLNKPESGFLSDFTEEELNAIMSVTQKNYLSAIDHSERDGGTEGIAATYDVASVNANSNNAYYKYLADMFFLPDITQISAIYKNLGSYYLAGESAYWVRTPMFDNSFSQRVVGHHGLIYHTAAFNNEIGVRPAFYLNENTVVIVSGSGSVDDPYIICGSSPVYIVEIVLEEKELSIPAGTTHALNVSYIPQNPTNRDLAWKSSDESVATVSSTGVITARTPGEAVITVTASEGGAFASITLTVTPKDEAVFTDFKFKQAIIDALFPGRSLNAPIYLDELENVISLNVSKKGIDNLSGIEQFKNLEYLYCDSNNLSSIDISWNNKLIWLDCGSNNLSAIDISHNTRLEYFYCNNNALEEIELSANTSLAGLNLGNNSIKYIDISANVALRQVSVNNNNLTRLDVRKNLTLSYLNITMNYLESDLYVIGLNRTQTELVFDPQVAIPVSKFSLSIEELTIPVGSMATIRGIFTPHNASNKKVLWETSDPSIADVTDEGKVFGVLPGVAGITATTEDGGISAECLVTVIDYDPPSIPEGLTVTARTGSSINLSWTKSLDNVLVDKYEVFRDNVLIATVFEESYNDVGLTPDKSYNYCVRAIDSSDNVSDLSEAVDAVSASPKILRVSPSVYSIIGGSGIQEITLTYANTQNHDGLSLDVYFAKDDESLVQLDGEYITPPPVRISAENSFVVNLNLAPLATGNYTFKFILTDRTKHSDTLTAYYTINRTVPGVVKDFNAYANERQATISWGVANEADVIGYNLYRAGHINGPYVLYASITGRNTKYYYDYQVFVGEVYYYKLTAVDKYGQEGDFTEVRSAVPIIDGTLPIVVGISPANYAQFSKTVQITATAIDNIAVTAIELQYSLDEGKTYITISKINTASKATFNLNTTLLPDIDIKVRALAYDGEGNVSDGTPVYTYSIKNTGPSKVTGLSAEWTTTTITLRWKDVPDYDLSHFTVEQYDEMKREYTAIGSVATTLGMNIYNRDPNTTYQYRVVAYDTRGNRGVESDPISVTTDPDTSPPVVTSINPKPGRYARNIPLTAVIKDDFAVRSVDIECSYNLSRWERVATLNAATPAVSVTFSYSFDLSGRPDGSIYIRFVPKDMAGNIGNSTSTAPFVEYLVDRTPPSAPQGVRVESGVGYLNIMWELGFESDLGKYFVYRSETANGEYVEIASNLQTRNYIDRNIKPDTVYYYKVAVDDTPGNMSEKSQVAFGIMSDDTEPPEIYSISPDEKYVLTAEHSVRVLAVDNYRLHKIVIDYKPVGTEVWLEGKTTYPTSYNDICELSIKDAGIGDGRYNFRAYAEDTSDNSSDYKYATYSVKITPPSLTNLKAEARASEIVLTWDSGNEPDLAVFTIYMKTGTGAFSFLYQLGNEHKDSYTYIAEGLDSTKTYTFKVEACDEYGNRFSAETPAIRPLPPEMVVPEDDTMPPVIIMTTPTLMQVGVAEYFDAMASYDNVGIASYLWEFGDGSKSNMPRQSHAYTGAGNFVVILTVTDYAGNASARTITVTVKERQYIGSVTVSVIDNAGRAVPSCGVYFALGTKNQQVYYTDNSGKVTIRATDGVYDIGVYKTGYLPEKHSVNFIQNTESNAPFRITKEDIIVGELTHKRMTLSEIIAAGIDVYAPENQYVFEFEVTLVYRLEERKLKFITNLDKVINYESVYIGNRVYTPCIVGGSSWVSSGGGSNSKTSVPMIIIVDVQGTASWLKEFFEVSLHLKNNAAAEFDVVDCVATINIPNGLTLVPGNGTQSGTSAQIGAMPGQSERTVTWILRGDRAGSYPLSADFSGTLALFNEPISAHFQSSSPILVNGSNDMFLDVTVEDGIIAGMNGAVRIGLTNESPYPVYMAQLSIDDVSVDGVSFSSGSSVNTEVLESGKTLSTVVSIPLSANATMAEYEDKVFTLASAVGRKIGGNTDIPIRFNTVPMGYIDGVFMELFATDPKTGKEYRLRDVLSIYSYQKKSVDIPEIRIETYRIDEDGTRYPISYDVTIKDESKGNGKPFTISTDSNGSGVMEGYKHEFSLSDIIKAKEYTITFTGSRIVPRQIKITFERDIVKDTKVCGFVYRKGTEILIPDALITITGLKPVRTTSAGFFQITGSIYAYDTLRIEADGYYALETPVYRADETDKNEGEEILRFELEEDPDPDTPVIECISWDLLSSKSYIVVPEGMMDVNIEYSLMPRYDRSKYRPGGFAFQVVDIDGNIKQPYKEHSVAFTDNPVYEFVFSSREVLSLKQGDRLEFAFIYYSIPENEKKVSVFRDSGLIVAPSLGSWGNIVRGLDNALTFYGKACEIINGKELSLASKTSNNARKENVKLFMEKFEGGMYESTKVAFEKVSIDILPEMEVKIGKSGKFKDPSIQYDWGGKLTMSGAFDKEFFKLSEKAEKTQSKYWKFSGDINPKIGITYVPSKGNWQFYFAAKGSLCIDADLVKLQTPTPYGVGVYLGMGIEGNLNGEWEITQTEALLDAIIPDVLSAKLKLEIRAGFSAVLTELASAGISLKAGIEVYFIPNSQMPEEITWNDLTLYFTVEGGFEESIIVWKWEQPEFNKMVRLLPMYSEINGSSGYLSLLQNDVLDYDEDESILNVVSRPEDASWIGHTIGDGHSETGILATGTFDNASARIGDLQNGKKLMVYVDYGENRDVNNPVLLKYSVYENGAWSRPLPVADDQTMDMYPYLTATDTGAQLVWVNFDKPLTNVQSVTQEYIKQNIISKMRIVKSTYNSLTGLWAPQTTISTDECLNIAPIVCVSGGRSMEVWIKNAGSKLSGDYENPDRLMFRYSQGENVIAVDEIPLTHHTLSGGTLGYISGRFILAFLATSDDGVTKLYTTYYLNDQWSEPIPVNTNMYDDYSPWMVVNEGWLELYYLNNGKLMVKNISNADMPRNVLSGGKVESIGEFKIVTNGAGNKALVWTSTCEGAQQIYLSIYDKSLGIYGEGTVVADMLDNEIPTGIDAVYSDGKIMITYTKTTYATEEGGTNSKSLEFVCVTAFVDLAVDTESVESTLAQYDGQDLTVSFTVRNTGTLSSVGYVAYVSTEPNGEGTVLGETMEHSAAISSGGSKTVRITFQVPENYSGEALYVFIKPYNQNDISGDNNFTDFDCAYNDIAISNPIFIKNEDDSYSMAVNVINSGFIDGEDIRIVVENAKTSSVISIIEAPVIKAGSSAVVQAFVIIPSGAFEDGIATIRVSAVQDRVDIDTDNNANIAIIQGSGSDVGQIMLGDVDFDNEITMSDVTLIYQCFRGKLLLPEDALLAADVDGDHEITIADVTLVYQAFRGKIQLQA